MSLRVSFHLDTLKVNIFTVIYGSNDDAHKAMMELPASVLAGASGGGGAATAPASGVMVKRGAA